MKTRKMEPRMGHKYSHIFDISLIPLWVQVQMMKQGGWVVL